jgi:hypothetical protein
MLLWPDPRAGSIHIILAHLGTTLKLNILYSMYYLTQRYAMMYKITIQSELMLAPEVSHHT